MAKHGYFRNFIFGVEDSLVSTVGLLSGVAIAGVPSRTILLTGVVLILVEAFSMAAGAACLSCVTYSLRTRRCRQWKSGAMKRRNATCWL